MRLLQRRRLTGPVIRRTVYWRPLAERRLDRIIMLAYVLIPWDGLSLTMWSLSVIMTGKRAHSQAKTQLLHRGFDDPPRPVISGRMGTSLEFIVEEFGTG